jgi:serine/threonine-protein phosphatase PGAM5
LYSNDHSPLNFVKYDETYPEDEKRLLTPLGRKQAEYTGKRLGEYIRGVNEEFGPCRVKVLRVSNLARAKETAQIIYDHLGEVNGMEIQLAESDPMLNEGR